MMCHPKEAEVRGIFIYPKNLTEEFSTFKMNYEKVL